MPLRPQANSLKLYSTPPTYSVLGQDAIDPKGGTYGAGCIRGVSIVTRGEAAGHDYWLDRTFLHQVADAVNSSGDGTKARYTHPELGGAATSPSFFLGRYTDGTVDGDSARGHVNFSPLADQSPEGKLATYTMARAKDDPKTFGASIAYRHDFSAEIAFINANGGERFTSPDPDNVNNLPHARLAELRAIDFVDDPAANPGGLFSVPQPGNVPAPQQVPGSPAIIDIGGSQLSTPSTTKTAAELEAEAKVKAEAEIKATAEAEAKVKADAEAKATADAAQAAADAAAQAAAAAAAVKVETPAPAAAQLSAGPKYLDLFGTDGGVWFAQGKSLDECHALYATKLKADLDAERAKVEQLTAHLTASRGGVPVTFVAGATAGGELSADAKEVARLSMVCGDGLGKLAAHVGNTLAAKATKTAGK